MVMNVPSASTVGKNGQPRKKAWKPKVKTGCITCRIRRVKCDEAKPVCVRCTSTGRKCDGYMPPAHSSQHLPSHEVVHSPWRPPLSYAMSGLQLESVEEHEAFHFFQYRSAAELSGFFDSGFWQLEIAQASHHLPGIRHAVVALAAMHRKLIAGQTPCVPDDSSDKQLRFALQKSNEAIREIVKSPGNKTIVDKINMMTVCILFHCLACIQGHQTTAFQHLRSGLMIFREVDEELESGAKYPDGHPISLDTLRAMLSNMDVQARWIMSDKMVETWEPQPRRLVVIYQTAFRTFVQARSYFESTLDDLLAFVQELDLCPPSTEEEIQATAQEYQRLHRQFDTGSLQLDEFLSQLPAKPSEGDKKSVIGIRLIHDQVQIFLKAFKEMDNERGIRAVDWAIEDEDMEVILDLACQLLHAPRDIQLPAGAVPEDLDSVDKSHTSSTTIAVLSPPVFSCCSGLLSALWVFTARTRNPVLRRRAIALFLKYPRREGVWDSILAGRIAWEQMRLEEQGLEDGSMEPKGLIVRDIVIKYPGLRVAQVEFRNVQQCEAGKPGVFRQIAW